GRPVAEARSEAVYGQVVAAHRIEHAKHRPMRERPSRLISRKDEFSLADDLHLSEDLERAVGQRDAMLTISLHAFGRNRPGLLGQVAELVPGRAKDFISARRC